MDRPRCHPSAKGDEPNVFDNVQVNAAKMILLADDNANDVELTLRALDRSHLANAVTVVHNGAAALDYLYRRQAFASRPPGNPLVALLDLRTPKVTGLEVLRRIKADPTLKTIPVVVLTSSRDEQDLIESDQLGTNAYVVKPVEFEKFIEAVKQLGLFWMLINESPSTAAQRSGAPAPPGWTFTPAFGGSDE